MQVMHSSVVLGDEGAWEQGKGGTTRQMSVTQLCFKLNPKEHLGYFGLLRLPRSRNAPKQLLKPNPNKSNPVCKVLEWFTWNVLHECSTRLCSFIASSRRVCADSISF